MFALEMRHFTPSIFELAHHIKRALWPVLNEQSRNAVYNLCVVQIYVCELADEERRRP